MQRGTGQRRSPPALPVDISDLEFGRPKRRWPLFALAYRATTAAIRVAGRERTLRVLLDLSFMTRRLALEQAQLLWPAGQYRSRAVSLAGTESMRPWIWPGCSVLDLGCGDGLGARMAATIGATEVVGIDHDPAALDAARRATSDERVRFLLGDVTSLAGQLPGAHFDVALLLHIIEHVEDPIVFLSRLRTIASRAIIEVPDVESDHLNLARRALGAPFYADADHVREYSTDTLRSHLTACGWHLRHIDRGRGVLFAVADAG